VAFTEGVGHGVDGGVEPGIKQEVGSVFKTKKGMDWKEENVHVFFIMAQSNYVTFAWGTHT
jgi:hypothetical protein